MSANKNSEAPKQAFYTVGGRSETAFRDLVGEYGFSLNKISHTNGEFKWEGMMLQITDPCSFLTFVRRLAAVKEMPGSELKEVKRATKDEENRLADLASTRLQFVAMQQIADEQTDDVS